MGKRDPRVDAYIEKSAEFAKPVLSYIRETVHAAVPDATETMKWSMPHFEHNGVLCGMAAFKQHCALNFWKASLLFDEIPSRESMGHFGRITSVKDLPSKKELTTLIKKAAKLNEEGVKVERARPARKGELETPPELATALRKVKGAKANFDNFPPSHRRDYVEWITEAKTESTRQKRIDQAVEWIAEGKSRNWKYMRGKN